MLRRICDTADVQLGIIEFCTKIRFFAQFLFIFFKLKIILILYKLLHKNLLLFNHSNHCSITYTSAFTSLDFVFIYTFVLTFSQL